MNNRFSCNPERRAQATDRRGPLFVARIVVGVLACARLAAAGGEAPPWMHALINVPLPAHDEKTDAVLLYSETNVTVLSTDRIKIQVRDAYKILRPYSRHYGTVAVYFNPQRKVRSLHGWCIPAQGKDYEVKDKDAVEVSPNIQGAELISDAKYKVLHIPASDPRNIVGYEYEWTSNLSFCKTSGVSRKQTQCGKATFPSNSPRAGSAKLPGSTIRKSSLRKLAAIHGSGR